MSSVGFRSGAASRKLIIVQATAVAFTVNFIMTKKFICSTTTEPKPIMIKTNQRQALPKTQTKQPPKTQTPAMTKEKHYK